MKMVIAVVIGIVAISTASIFIKLCDAHPLAVAAYRLAGPVESCGWDLHFGWDLCSNEGRYDGNGCNH